MRPLPVYPTEHPLPWPADVVAAERGHHTGAWNLDDVQVATFDALLHEIHPDAPRVDADRLSQLARWLLSLPMDVAHTVLDQRLTRIEELRAMIHDPDWDCTEPDCVRVRNLLHYIDQGDDLLPDRIPQLGRLDDVLLLELAWPAVSAEAEEYRDFSAYREDEHPAGGGSEQRAAWIRDRLTEMALWQHKQRVHDSRYVEGGQPNQRFRVS